MAMQAANPAAAVLRPAQIVGNAFVEQYYHILHYSPELVYRFYQDSSVLSRPDSDGTMTSVTTMQAINEKIQSLYSKNYKTEIKTADAQDSYHMGVIVLVTGSLTVRDNVKRKFTQTFFLAPQENGYFVLNDVFRYVDENEQSEINSTSVHGIGHSITVVPSDPEPAHVPANPVSDPSTTLEYENLEDLQNGPEYDPSDNEEGSVYEEEVINELPSHSSQNDTSSAVVDLDSSPAEGEKKSYASIVKVKKAADATSASVYVPTSSLRWAPTKTSEKPLTSAIPSPESEASAPTSASPPESNNAHETSIAEGHSIYIRNLPLNATETQIEEEFRKFGPIKHGGVQVRSNKQRFCFGFVEFESLDSMQTAIKESPILIGGRKVVVEEKRTTTRVGSSGRGRYPSGRGGFWNNSFRGRGGFGGRGFGRNEFRNQHDFSSRPKGAIVRITASTYRQVDRNGSGKNGHQAEG